MILELNNVRKNFKSSNFILDDISFQLPSGAIMGFVGENGAGKTTTIDCILNTLFPDSGTIQIFGQNNTDDNAALRAQIGVVYDGGNFPGYLNAKEIATIMRGIYNNWDDTLFEQYLCTFNLPPRQKIATYSKGMTMKLAIAAALSHHPKLLILDEATSGLDPVIRDDILDILLDFVGDDDHSILMSSHISSDLERIADYITFIHQGRILLSAAKDDLLYHYGIMRCKESQFSCLDRSDIIAYRRLKYQIDVLISDEKEMRRKYKDILIDRATIDEIMLLLVKGEQQ